jgi:hypothetical protein
MLRRFDNSFARRKLLALFLIAFWVLIPVSLPQSDPDFLDGMEQEEPIEPTALNPGSDSYRTKRKLSIETTLPWIGKEGALTPSLYRIAIQQTAKQDLKIFRLTEVIRC